MNIILIGLSVFAVASQIIFGSRALVNENTKSELGLKPEVKSDVDDSVEVFIDNTLTVTSHPTPLPTKTLPTRFSGFVYPNSQIVENNNSKILLVSSDHPDAITDWYKDKIKDMGMNVTSFVVTKTNDNVENKLVGAMNSDKVTVDIIKSSGSSTISITVK